MKKYWVLFKVQWQAMLAYRAQVVLWFLISAAQTAFLLYLWIAVYSNGGKIGDYSFNELLTYYILQLFITEIVATYISWDMIEEIKYGNFTQYLLKPMSYFKWQAVLNFSSKSRELVFVIFGLGIIGFAFAGYTVGPSSLTAFFHVAILTMLATFIAFVLEFFVGIGAFWLTNVMSFRFLIYTLGRLFSGALIPLELLPKSLFQISQFLPFPFFSYIPAQVYLGRIDNVWPFYFTGIAWFVVIYFVARYLYKRGVKQYEAVGA